MFGEIMCVNGTHLTQILNQFYAIVFFLVILVSLIVLFSILIVSSSTYKRFRVVLVGYIADKNCGEALGNFH